MSLFRMTLFSIVFFSLIYPAHAQDAGASVFQANCQMCHGADGTSNTPTGKAFKAPNLHDASVMKMSDDDLAKIIRDGKGNMPAFQSRLSPKEVQDVVAYIRVLEKH